MSGSCSFEGCTVDETGTCALSREPSSCSNRVLIESVLDRSKSALDPELAGSSSADRFGAPVLSQPERASAFPSSGTLGLNDINAMMAAKYVNVVGILGDPESGKTACLASLYLLVSNSMLSGWSFADSKSLSAFEEIARGARDWNGGNPAEEMTVHTELADDHRPGFLHIRLVRKADGRRVDFALPDIPGEWTQALIMNARSDRLSFLKSAETIWIVLDGRTLADTEKRHGLIARVGQLAQRLNTMLAEKIPSVIIVITHRDLHTPTDNVIGRLEREFTKRGAKAEIVSIAPFSDDPDTIPAGHGIADLINRTVTGSADRPIFWASSDPAEGKRSYLNFRRDK